MNQPRSTSDNPPLSPFILLCDADHDKFPKTPTLPKNKTPELGRNFVVVVKQGFIEIKPIRNEQNSKVVIVVIVVKNLAILVLYNNDGVR
jgi:hypothetical protein